MVFCSKKYLYFLWILCLSSPCYAAWYGEFGIAISHPASNYVESDNKLIEFGYQNDIGYGNYRLGVGGWLDKTEWKGARSSLYINPSLCLNPTASGYYSYYCLGMAGLSHPDTLLSTPFQFSQELGFGMRGYSHNREIRVGIAIKHFSNAGIKRPNVGRNFIVLTTQF